jgi:RNA polymerase sigma-70 factor (ECF subfamily)
MQNDDFLVQQTLAGEHEAFHRLIILYQADVHAFVISWVKNPEDAKELVQDIFLEAYRDLASLKQPERFYFWLRQIAKHRCQNWRERKSQDRFVPLSEDIVAETPSVDETLILRETLAKMMQAIDELPETEKRILKERYLDDSSYAELQAKHGLSYKALNMRLLRAKEKVRENVKKALAGIGILTFRYSAEDILTKGVVAVKIGLKIKIIIAVTTAVIILSGSGVIVWHYQRSQQEKSAIGQELQLLPKTNTVLTTEKHPVKKISSISQKDRKREDKEEVATNLNTSEEAENHVLMEGANDKAQKTVDPKKEILAFGLTREEIAARIPVIEEEIKTEMTRIINIGNQIQEYIRTGQNRTDDAIDKWCAEADREVQKAWMDLYNTKIQLYISYRVQLEGKNLKFPLTKGGSLYEMIQLLPFNVFPREFSELTWVDDKK